MTSITAAPSAVTGLWASVPVFNYLSSAFGCIELQIIIVCLLFLSIHAIWLCIYIYMEQKIRF